MLVEDETLISRFHQIWRYGRKRFKEALMIIDARLILSEEKKVWIALGNKPKQAS